MPVIKIKTPLKAKKPWHVYALVRTDTDEIFYVGIGNAWRFKQLDIEAYLEAHRYGPDQTI
jgi:hypothetical protein